MIYLNSVGHASYTVFRMLLTYYSYVAPLSILLFWHEGLRSKNGLARYLPPT